MAMSGMNVLRAIVVILCAAIACAGGGSQALAQATQLLPGEQCFQATTGINGMVGTLGTITVRLLNPTASSISLTTMTIRAMAMGMTP